ncbi:MAG: carboxypeptidase regulatory-like domain-containing protein [Zoogloeaceae bacterium]|nr:carboxypeptidase regulatory-like domain-containing protein [Zoogloeaceae bacterium]
MSTPSLRRFKALAGSALLAGSLMTAAVAAEPFTPPTSSAVPYLSGGVGETERDRMSAMAAAFNLKIVTAKPTGEYLAGVTLLIRDQEGRPMLSTVAQGPILLAQLPPGRYSVMAINGDDIRQEAVTVRPARQAVLRLHMDEA